jgi:hypothetical protein
LVGNAELDNKTTSYTTGQKVFVIDTFYTSGGSGIVVEEQYRRKFSLLVALLRDFQDA